MPTQKSWVFDPNSGGKTIPPKVKTDIEQRIRKVAEENFQGHYTRLDVHFRAQFCYIDAYTEPVLTDGWPPDGWPETREEYVERLRNTPTHLCRLRYFGNERWGLAFYLYSSDKYELSVFPDGDFFGTPEDAFITAAGFHLTE